MFRKYARPMVAALLSVAALQASASTVYWADWTSSSTDNSGAAQVLGTLTTPTDTVGVTYTNAQGIYNVQTSGGIDYWTPRTTASPYISAAVDNAPTGTDIVQLQYAGSQTLAFSQKVRNLVFSVVSLNGNGYGFDQDFDILSVGDGVGEDCGYWGCGNFTKQVVDLGGGVFQYQLIGTNEPHGTIRFLGEFDTIAWNSLSNELWNGFSIGVQGLAVDPPNVPVPAVPVLLGLGLMGLRTLRRRT
jgi:hypothetical protein